MGVGTLEQLSFWEPAPASVAVEPPPFRLLVTGGRDAVDMYEVWGLLDYFTQDVRRDWRRRIIVVHGECDGVDDFADQWASQRARVKPEPHPAENFGPWPRCGPIRNSHMVALGADLCVAMPTPGSKGTWDCAKKAHDAGIPVRLWSVKGGAPRR